MKYISGLILVVLIAVGAFLLWPRGASSPDVVSPSGSVACTAEAKVCPDGTAVGRTGPNCEFAACPETPVTTTLPEDLVLSVGEGKSLGGLELTLVSIEQDSRCPVDVQCVWAGTLVAKVALAAGGERVTRSISLGAPPVVFLGYKVSLVDSAPAPKSTMSISQNAYRITFHVSE